MTGRGTLTRLSRLSRLGALLLLLVAALHCPLSMATAATPPATPPRPATVLPATFLTDAARLSTILQTMPGLSADQRATFAARLNPIVISLRAADGLRRAEDDDTTMISAVVSERTNALTALTAMHARIDADVRAFDDALSQTLPVSATAATTAVTATIDITSARLDLQQNTANVALRVTADARVLGLLALSIRDATDTQRLTGQIDALASGVHLALAAVLTDLNVLRQTDATAVDALRPRLGSDVDAALAQVDGTIIGNLDTRATDLRGDRARLSTRESTLLAPAAIALVAVQRDILAAGASSPRPDDPAVAPVRAALSVASADLRGAAARAPALAAADQDLTAFQAIQDSIDREVRAARAGIDADLAQSDADLQGRLQADVTLSISQTEETVHVHVDNIDAGAVSRVLDFDVGTGMSVLGIAVLHATVTPGTGATGGGSDARLQGVDLVLQARLTGLQAHVHTDVAAVRDEQQALRARIEARITALQQSLAMTVTPFLSAKTATATALRTQIDTDLASALTQLLAATARLVPPAGH